MIINATSHTIKNIWIVFLFIFSLTIILFIVLIQGIRIENLNLPQIKIEQLYIKLDKKLIVSADKVKIGINSKNNTSLAEIKNLSKNLPYFHSLFKSISIMNLILNNKTIHFLYKDKNFYVDSDLLNIDAKIKDNGEELELIINDATLKDFHIEFKGILKANISEKKVDFKGRFKVFNINGNLNLKLDNTKLFYRLNSKKFYTLKPFMDFLSKKINLDPIIAGWIYKRIIAKEYLLENFEGMFNFKNNDFFPNLMKAQAKTKKVRIKFDANVPAATVENLTIKLDNNKLIFKTKKAKYENKIVKNPNIYIYNLMTKNPGIIINIKTKAKLDKSIQKILKAFNINIPITQTSGKAKSSLTLDILFDPLNVRNYTGSFELKNSNISISGLPIYSKKAKVILNNNIIDIKYANLQYANLFDIDTRGRLNIQKKIYKSNNTINSLHVNFNNITLLNIKDFNTAATMYLKDKKTKIVIDKLKSTLQFKNDNNQINLNNLSLLYPYSNPMREFQINKGKGVINTRNFKDFNASIDIQNINLPLEQNGIKIKKLNATIKTNGNKIDMISKNKQLQISYDKKLTIKIKNVDVEFNSSSTTNKNKIKQIEITGINSNIIDINSSLKIPSYKFSYKINDKNTTFKTNKGVQKLALNTSINKLYLSSQNLSDLYINSLLGENAFKGGVFELNMYGKDFKDVKGSFIFKNTNIKSLKFFNNLMAFINTIPALVTLKTPGFDENGYQIKEGFLIFKKYNKILTIKEIKIIGNSADIIGNGNVDLDTGTLDINLQIAIFKSASSIINKIPLVGYILLGDDGKLYTSVKITGTKDKPKITTSVISDTIISPFKILKRTFELPIKIFQ